MTTAARIAPESGRLAAPFVHAFETKSAKYAFDVNSRRIVHVDDLRWALLSNWAAADAQIAEDLHGGVAAGDVTAAREEIGALGASGELFSPKRPSAVRTLFRREDMEQDLSRNCHQITLNVSEQCNLRCAYCCYSGSHVQERRHSSRMMTWETARKALDFYVSRSQWTMARWKNRPEDPKLIRYDDGIDKPCVGFYGGEPLTNWPLMKRVIEFVRSLPDGNEYLVNFTTNGTLLTPEISDFLCANKVSVLVSLDGPKEMHDRYRRFAGGGGTWETVTGNLTYILDNMPDYYREYVGLGCVIAPPCDLWSLIEFASNCELNAGRGFRFNGLDEDTPSCFWDPIDDADRRTTGRERVWQEYLDALFAGKMTDDYVPSTQQEEWRLRLLRQMQDRRLDRVYGRAKRLAPGQTMLPETYYTNFGVCPPGRERIFVQVDGRICPCERVPSQAEAFIIGDVDKGFDIDAIMRLCEGTAALLEDRCVDCWNLPLCTIRCKSLVGADGRLSREVRLKECEKNKRNSHRALVDVCSILERDPGALRYLDSV